MARLALVDVVRPYVMAGASLQPQFQHVLELLHVDEYDTAVDEDAVVFWGVARIDESATGLPTFPSPRSGDVTFEWHDLAVRFRLTAARLPAAAVDPAQLSDPDVRAALQAMGSATAGTRSDFPDTQFRLDLMFELVTATFPKLTGAKVSGAYLEPDPEHRTVKIHLPRVVMRLTQDSAADTDVDLTLGTWGAETIDDADPAIGSLIRMTPTYALADGGKFGFGFEKAVVDFSEERTPPDILERFGLGDDWQGIHLPELRLFFADDQASGTAGNVGARDLLVGFEPEVALWGDVSFDVDFRGDAVAVGLRLYSVDGTRIDPTPVNPNNATDAEAAPQARYQVTVPSSAGPETENYLLYVDVKRGAAPFTITAVTGQDHPADLDTFPDDAFFDNPANSPGALSVVQRVRLFSHDQRAALRITSRNPAQRRVIVLDVYPDRQAASLHPAPRPPNDARLTNVHAESFGSIAIRPPQANTAVVIAFTPPDVHTFSADGTAVSVTGGQATVPIAAGETVALAATWLRPGEGELGRVTAYFEFDRPQGADIGRVSSRPIEPSSTRADLEFDAFRDAWVNRDTSQPRPRVRIDAYASREDEARISYNRELATRRMNVLRDRILAAGIPDLAAADIDLQAPWGEDGHPSSGPPPPDPRLIEGHTPGNQSADAAHEGGNYRPERFRTAVASIIAPTIGTSTVTADLVRDAETSPDRAPDPAPPASQQPDWLRTLGGTLRWEREPYPIAGEFRMTVDFKTAHEEGLEEFRDDIETIRPGLEAPEEARLPDPGSAPNPEDGVVEFRLAITYDPATGTFTETLVARAAEADRDGLWSWGTIPAADSCREPRRVDRCWGSGLHGMPGWFRGGATSSALRGSGSGSSRAVDCLLGTCHGARLGEVGRPAGPGPAAAHEWSTPGHRSGDVTWDGGSGRRVPGTAEVLVPIGLPLEESPCTFRRLSVCSGSTLASPATTPPSWSTTPAASAPAVAPAPRSPASPRSRKPRSPPPTQPPIWSWWWSRPARRGCRSRCSSAAAATPCCGSARPRPPTCAGSWPAMPRATASTPRPSPGCHWSLPRGWCRWSWAARRGRRWTVAYAPWLGSPPTSAGARPASAPSPNS